MSQHASVLHGKSMERHSYPLRKALDDEHVWMWEAYGFSGGMVTLHNLLNELTVCKYANRAAALGVRYRGDGMVTVEVDEELWVPRFQITHDYRVFGAVTGSLAVLRPSLTPVQCALWFCTANRWLAGEAPMDVVRVSEAAVLAAARGDALQMARH